LKTLGKITVAILAFICIGATFGMVTGSTKLNPNDIAPTLLIFTLVSIFCVWAYIKMSKK
jgi:heme A synthase